jgi:hypothetical protein
MALLMQRGFKVHGVLPAQDSRHDQELGELPFSSADTVSNKRAVYPLHVLGARGQRIAVPKIHTVVLGAMGSITSATVDMLDVVGVHGVQGTALLRELQGQVV